MNKLFTKIAALALGMTMAVGVGVAVASNKEVTRVDASPEQGYTAATMTAGTNGSSCTVNGYDGIKVGTSSKGGTMSITVPSGATKLVLYAAAWKGVTGLSLNITKDSGAASATISPASIALTADNGISNNSPFTLSGTESNYRFELTLANITAETKYIFTSSIAKRFVVWSAQTKAATTYTISYNANGGSGTMSSTTGTNPAVAACTFTPPSNKQFSYWHTTSSGTGGTTYAVGDTPKANLSLYAIWEDLPSDPFVSLTLTSGSPAYKGSTVTVSATTANLEGSGLTWTVTAGSVTGISSTNTSFTGTLASTGTVTIKAQDNGGDTSDTVSVTVNAVTVSLDETSATVAQSGSLTLTATVNTGSVAWSSDNAKVTVAADPQNALKGIVTVAADAAVNSTATITATSTIDSTVHPTCTITVSENPFTTFTKLTNSNQVSTSAVYVLSNEGTYWAGNAVDSSQIASASDIADVGFFKLESTTNGYYLKYVVKNAQTGAYEDATGNKYINNSSGTGLSSSSSGASVWVANNDGEYGVMLQNSSNDNRFLGWSKGNVTSSSVARAYSTKNLHAGDDNAPVYLYEVPQNKLDGLTVSGQTTSFTSGSKFTLGNNAVLTAHYSSTGDTTDLSGGTISYKINNIDVTTNTTLDHDTHNGKSVVITYTDAAGDKASTTAYTITVNYKPAEGISLNLISAPLSIGGSVELTATVSDEFANPNDVSWSTSASGVASISAASGTKTITVTGVSAGSATITATANGHSATCAISVTADPILNLKDSGDNIINDETLEFFTGDNSVMIQAVSENVASPVYSWENEDDSVVTINAVDKNCEVTIVGAGSSDVSVTVGALTRTVTFSIVQSGVTSLTLESSVPSGELFDGTYKNKLTLTPAVTLVGNATGVINWSSSDTDVATVSDASTTAPTAITVTGVGEGTATITARSAYTPSMSETFDVTVTADGVEELSWTNKPYFDSDTSKSHIQIFANETTLAQIAEAGNSSYGTFTPSWASGKTDAPTFGTGADNVHLVLSDTVVDSEAGLTPLSASSTFTKNDNGKYVLAFYHGVRAKGTMPKITVINWRHVEETNTSTATYNFTSATSSTTAMSSTTFDGFYVISSTLAKGTSDPSYIYPDAGSIKLASGNYPGSLTITFGTDVKISSVTVRAKLYGTDSTVLTIMGNDITDLGDSYVNYTFSVKNGDFTETNEFSLCTGAKKQRCYIESIVIVAGGTQDISKTSDCLGLEVFIDNYLHMDDYPGTEGQAGPGWCKDDEHDYYGKETETGAKAAFNALSDRQKSLFTSNSAYTAEWARLSAWAAANGESLNTTTNKLSASGITGLMNIAGNTNATAIVVIVSVISLTAIGGYFFLRKRREEN